MRKKLLILVLTTTTVLMLLSYFIASTGNLSVTINGEQVQGAQALGVASGGVFISLLISALATIVVAVIALGASFIVSAMLVFVLCVGLLAFSPVFLPVVISAAIAAWLMRKKSPIQSDAQKNKTYL